MVVLEAVFNEPCLCSAGVSTSSLTGPQAAAVVADLSETTFHTEDGDLM